MKRISLIIPFLLCIIVISACTQESEQKNNAVAQYEEAMADIIDAKTPLTRVALMATVKSSMEEAANNGSACAMNMMVYFYNPEYHSSYRKEAKPPEEINYMGYKDEIHGWSKKFEEALRKKVTEGNGRAMLYLSYGYNSRWDLLSLSHMVKDDSLSQAWLQRSIDAGTPEAYIFKARFTEDVGQKKLLYKTAAELGNGYAYRAWAELESEDPVAHFEVVESALEAEASGIHEWLTWELDTLDEQVSLGNQESIPFKQMADSLNLRNRLAQVPETPLPRAWDMFCNETDGLQ